MIPKYYTFKQLYPSRLLLLFDLQSVFGNINEIFNDSNWYNQDVMSIIDLFYKYLLGKTSKLYFIWDDTELDDKLPLFINALWNPIYEFYRKQLVYVKQNLNQLKDEDKRGSHLHGNTDQASTSYSQPTETGIKWDNAKDAPTSKIGTDRNIDNQNIMNDMLRTTNSNMYVFYSTLWSKVIHMFIDQKYIKECERGV